MGYAHYLPQSSCVWVVPCLFTPDWISLPEADCHNNLSFYLSPVTIYYIILFYFLHSTPPPSFSGMILVVYKFILHLPF